MAKQLLHPTKGWIDKTQQPSSWSALLRSAGSIGSGLIKALQTGTSKKYTFTNPDYVQAAPTPSVMGAQDTQDPTPTPTPRLNVNVPRALEDSLRQSSSKHGVDPTIFSNQLARESMNYNPKVLTGELKSPVGATGVAQFMPETAQWWAKTVGQFDPNNPEQAIPAAAQYMKYLLDQFEGDYESALAAYNWGEGNVRSHLRKYGSINRSKLPKETRDYLSNILTE